MSRFVTVTVRSLCFILAIAGLAAAQEPPPLEPPPLEPPRASATETNQPEPASTPATPKAATPKPAASAQPNAARPTLPRADVRPMLAIPGITAPASRPSAAYRPPLAGPGRTGNPGVSPPLDALPLPSQFPPARSPLDSSGFPLTEGSSSPSLDALSPLSGRSMPRGASNPAVMSRSGALTATPPGETIPLTVEPLDEELSKDSKDAGRGARPRASNGRPNGGTSPTRIEPDDEPISPRPAPRRGTGVLGRLFGLQPAPLPPRRETPRSDDSKPKRGPDADSDLDPDLVARRRIDRQIRATLGDKVRSYDVQITGRNVVISAQPSRFWLRRSVRRSLETLPALQGYRARIEISD